MSMFPISRWVGALQGLYNLKGKKTLKRLIAGLSKRFQHPQFKKKHKQGHWESFETADLHH